MSGCLNYDLFDYRAPGVPGLGYHPDWLTAGAEAALVRQVDARPWNNSLQRRTQHYGRRYDAPAGGGEAEPFPFWLAMYARRLQLEGHSLARPDRVSVNEYRPGQGIGAHIDKGGRRIPAIMILSLGSSCVMEFTHTASGRKINQLLQPRSLTVISGEARYGWTHAIPRRLADRVDGLTIPRKRRISLMFRAAVDG